MRETKKVCPDAKRETGSTPVRLERSERPDPAGPLAALSEASEPPGGRRHHSTCWPACHQVPAVGELEHRLEPLRVHPAVRLVLPQRVGEQVLVPRRLLGVDL